MPGCGWTPCASTSPARSGSPATAWAPGSRSAPPASSPTTWRRSAASTGVGWSPRHPRARTWCWAGRGRALEDAGLAHTNEIYPGAAHGYTMADTSMYDEAATERHFAALEELFD